MNTLLVSSAVLASDFDLDSDTVTPGVLGFLAIFSIGVALYFLMRSLLVKLRGVSAQAEEQEAEEQAAAEAAESGVGADEAEEDSEKGSGADASDGGSATGSAAEDASAKS